MSRSGTTQLDDRKQSTSTFNLEQHPGAPREMLRPRGAWTDASAYDTTAKKLAGLFRENFKRYEAGVSAEITAAGPV